MRHEESKYRSSVPTEEKKIKSVVHTIKKSSRRGPIYLSRDPSYNVSDDGTLFIFLNAMKDSHNCEAEEDTKEKQQHIPS
jgi:hypothetical protein